MRQLHTRAALQNTKGSHVQLARAHAAWLETLCLDTPQLCSTCKSYPDPCLPHFNSVAIFLPIGRRCRGLFVQLEPYVARFASANGLDVSSNPSAARALQEVCSLAYALQVAAR